MQQLTRLEKTVTPSKKTPKSKKSTSIVPLPQSELKLRDYQKQVISDLYQLFCTPNINSALLYAPTGAGKTVIAVKVIADAVGRGRRVLFLVHRKKLVAQTQATLQSCYGIKSGIIWGNHPTNYDAPVQIAMIQTLQNRELPPDIGLVIFDECHSSIYYSISQKVMQYYATTATNLAGLLALSPCYFLGLTATPWRTKQKEGFCQFFQALVRAPDPIDLVKLGYLARPRLFGYGGLIDFSQLENSNGDYSESSMQKVCDEEYNANVVKNFIEKCPQRKAIAFCAGVTQADDLARQFEEKGITTEVVIGETPDDEREAIYQRFAQGKTQIISSVGCLCEGFDEPSVEAVIIARPTRSRSLLIQMVGRGLRLHPGKPDCYLLDFGECFKRVCRPTTKLQMSLCPDEKQFIPDAWLKECRQCNALIPKFARICPECGYVYPDGEKIDLEDEADLPLFGEILTPEEEQQLRYIRQQMKRKYNKGKNPARVKKLFLEKFGYFAPDEWFVGSIFGQGIRSQSNQTLYQNFLYTVRPDAPHSWIKYMMELEFGKFGKTYNFRDSGEYHPKSIDPSQKHYWWEILGINPNAPWGMIKSAYRELAKRWHPDICGDEIAAEEMKLINWAFDQARAIRGE